MGHGGAQQQQCLGLWGESTAVNNGTWHTSMSWSAEGHHSLQVVEFGGRFFIEKCLTFGGGRSPTLCHMLASLLIQWQRLEVGSGMTS